MKIGTTGILVDHLGQVLLVQRNDTRTFTPPGGALDRGELPTDGIIREMKEETGLIVLPVRLASLDFWDDRPDGSLIFNFRCLLRGGDVTPSEETPHVGFYTPQEFPRPMLRMHRDRLELTMRHAGGPPAWNEYRRGAGGRLLRFLLRQTVYRFLDLKRAVQKQPAYQQPTGWELHVHTILQNDTGDVLWVRAAGAAAWQLPGGTNLPRTAPWESARRLAQGQTGYAAEPVNLAAVTVDEGSNRLDMWFTAVGPTDITVSEAAYFAAPPPDSDAAQQAILPTALRREETEFLRPPATES